MYRFLTLICLLLTAFSATAQNYYINGTVRDDESGEPLAHVHVYEPALKIGTLTNEDGYFMLRLPGGKRVIRMARTGYNAVVDSFFLNMGTTINASMEEDMFYSDGSQAPSYAMDHLPGDNEILSENLEYIPQVLGEFDVLKNLQYLPGVQAGLEGSSGLYIRGGGMDQNLVLLDGNPVYNTTHLFGFLSSFNIDAISGFKLYKGAMPAQYGSRSSSVLDMRVREGNIYEPSGKIGIGLLNAYGFLEFPVFSEKTTISVSGKRSIPGFANVINPIYDPQSDAIPQTYLYDWHVKLTHQLSKKDKLSLLYYSSKDFFSSELTQQSQNGSAIFQDIFTDRIEWANHVAAFRWIRQHSRKLVGKYNLSYIRYNYEVFQGLERKVNSDTANGAGSYNVTYNSGIDEILARSDWEYRLNETQLWRFGVWQSSRRFRQGSLSAFASNIGINLDTSLGYNEPLWSNELALYAEDDIQVNQQTNVRVGVRLGTYYAGGKLWVVPEPRVSSAYLINEKWLINASYNYARQNLHMLTNSGVGLPTDLWLPATPNIGPQGVHQGSIGTRGRLKKGYEFSAEVYYKAMRQVIDYAEGTSSIDVQLDWEDRVEQGNGRAYGLELMLQKKKGDFNGILSYTLARSTRTIDGINGGRTYNFRYDRRHQVSLHLIYKASRRYHYAVNIVYGTGYPVTFPYGRFRDINGRVVYDYQEKNGYNLRDYFRVDIGLISRRALLDNDLDSRFSQEFNLSVFNLLNRFNPAFLYVRQNDQGEYTAREVALFPIFPAINYRLKF